MGIPLVLKLMRASSSQNLIRREATRSIPRILAKETPKEESKFQDRIKKERDVKQEEDPEKGRGRGEEKGKVKPKRGLENPEKEDNAIKEILKDGPQSERDKVLDDGSKDKINEILDKGKDDFRQRIIEERGWSPDDGAKMEVNEPASIASEVDKVSFFELASLGNNSTPEQPIFDIEMSNLTFASDYETNDVDIDGGDGGDGD